MKKIIIVSSLLFVSLLAKCQETIGMGFSAGLSSRNCAIGEVYVQKLAVISPSLSIQVHSKVRNPSIPVIFEGRISHIFNKFEPYIGYGFHAAGQDAKKEFRQFTGLRPAIGAIFHFRDLIILSGGISGSIYTFKIGLFLKK